MKFKMAATAGLSLTLDPMGKMFQNASSLKPIGQLKPNCPGMIIGRSFPIGIKNTHLVEDLPMIIPGQFGFNYPSGFGEEAF
jgi:succinyl-CoA synthetase alpha subunit